jgi:uncharacterized oligopeptide transporter (OPT) family protein
MRKKTVITSLLISIPLTGSSIYVALKMGALPWPSIFCAIVAYAILSGRDLREVNIAEAGGTTGALIGGAVAFTLPAIWFMGGEITITDALRFSAVLLIASLTGIFLSSALRERFLDSLPFPEGQATAETLKSIRVNRWFFVALALAGIFAQIRDFFAPAGCTFVIAGITLVFSPLLMGVGGGYIMGKKASFSWFAGAVLGWVVLEPLIGLEPSIVQNIGLGVLLGSSMAFLASFLVGARFSRISVILTVVAFVVLSLLGINPVASAIAVLMGNMFAMVAFRMTGETNVDPLEQFGLLTGIVIFAIFGYLGIGITLTSLIICVLFVACLAAVCGDIGHDFKAARLLGTDAGEIVRIEVISTALASVLAPLFLLLIRNVYPTQLFTEVMPAPQAQLIARSLFGYEHPWVFLAAFVASFSVQLLLGNRFLSLSALGIGIFLNLNLGLLFFIGGVWRAIDERRNKTDTSVPSALLAGEGIAGFASVIMLALGVRRSYTTAVLLILFIVFLANNLISKRDAAQ